LNDQALAQRPLAEVVANNIAAIAPNTGISINHLHKLHDIAKHHDCIIAFRPVDPHNAQLIEQGFPTKGLAIKGKSSNIGPLYGFVPFEQALARPLGKSQSELEEAQMQTSTCVHAGHSVKIPLELSESRIRYLISVGVMTIIGVGSPKHFNVRAPDHPDLAFSLSRTDLGNYRVLLDNKRVEVLAPLKTDGKPLRPYTADYDLFFLMPTWDKLPSQSQRRPSIQPPAFGEHRTSLTSLKNKVVDNVSQHFAPPIASHSDPIDYITSLESLVIDNINRELRGDLLAEYHAGPSPWNLVHHGSDEGNPKTNFASNLPATIIAPTALGSLGAIILANDKRALAEVLEEAQARGYVLSGNRKWFDDELPNRTRRQVSTLSDRHGNAASMSPPDSRRGSLVIGKRRGSGLSEQDQNVLALAGRGRRSNSYLQSLTARQSYSTPNSIDAPPSLPSNPDFVD
jgi:hypothetical protein